MACPTCDHTMTGLTTGLFWCPRCGTIKEFRDQGMHENMDAPKLVTRCRSYQKQMAANCPLWQQLGIAESINKPGQRG